MPRHRLGVVLLLPEPVATEVNGLRRACGDPALSSIAPHITLVPPVNVRANDVADGLRVLRLAAGSVPRPLTLTIGPAATFLPTSPTLFLDVGADRPALGLLREGLFRPPLQRPVDHPFHPHVTVAVELPEPRLASAVSALSGYRTVVEISRVTVLEQRRSTVGHRAWFPLADAAFGPPVSVERGGRRLEVTDSPIPDPEVSRLLVDHGYDLPAGRPGGRPGGRYVAARSEDRVVGALTVVGVGGARPTIDAVVVAADARRAGLGRLLVERAVLLASEGPASWIEADPQRVRHDWLAALGWRRREETSQIPRMWRPV